MGRKADRRQGSVAEYPGWIVPRRAAGGRRPSNAESIGTCARALTQVATQAVIAQARTCTPSRRFRPRVSDVLLQVRNYRVARRPCGRPALSELGMKVYLLPAQALRTPPERRRGFETGRR